MDRLVTDPDRSVGLTNLGDYETHPLQSNQTWVHGYYGALVMVELSPTMKTSREE